MQKSQRPISNQKRAQNRYTKVNRLEIGLKSAPYFEHKKPEK
jgi:hypothetical protein